MFNNEKETNQDNLRNRKKDELKKILKEFITLIMCVPNWEARDKIIDETEQKINKLF